MENKILLAHGGGGTHTQKLIGEVFQKHLHNPSFTADDAAVLPFGTDRLAFSTDGFIVSPYKFSGGNIGTLAVCGTVNDLACMGATPLWLSAAFVLEEGFAVEELETIVASMAETAKKANVAVVCGDTKVCAKGQVDKIFITTSGIGRVDTENPPSGARAKDGDAILVTGDIGRHGATILVARNEFGLQTEITSDCAPLAHLVQALIRAGISLHVVRDATRGGVGTVLYEIAHQSHIGIRIIDSALPVAPEVSGITRMLGLDPLYLACEGRLVLMLPKEEAPKALAILHELPNGANASIIGSVEKDLKACAVVRETILGQTTLLPEPTGELLPRIC